VRSWREDPNKTFIQIRKKNVGPTRYKSTTNPSVSTGNKSKKNEKNRISAINIIEPGNPRKIKQLIKARRNSFGHKKFIPLNSVIKRVLNRRPIASTSKKEFVERRA
jgi:hypothetical protein